MPYRESAKSAPSSARKRPPPSLVLTRPRPWVLLAIAIGLAGLALLFLPLALGADLDCRRAAPGATPECTMKAWLAREIRFSGTPNALGLVIRDETNKETMLEADGMATRELHDPAARAAQADYETFVASSHASRFHRHVRGARFHGTLVMAFAFAAIGSMVAGLFIERAQRVIVDAEIDELVIEGIAFVRRTSEVTLPLSKIERIDVRDAGETFELIVVYDGHERAVMRADASGCQRAAMIIQANI